LYLKFTIIPLISPLNQEDLVTEKLTGREMARQNEEFSSGKIF
jgi:hypothetical protein